MVQDPQSGVLRVNFDPALVRLLREVRYFLLLPDLPIEIPANALKVSYHAVTSCALSVASTCCNITNLYMNNRRNNVCLPGIFYKGR